MTKTMRFLTLCLVVLGLGACAGGHTVGGLALQSQPSMESGLLGTPGATGGELYVASWFPPFFSEYALALHSGDRPLLTLTGVSQPVPIVASRRDLYVGSFNQGLVYTYSLPLQGSLERPEDPTAGFPSGLSNLSALAVDGRFLYAAGQTASETEVLAYRLPLTPGELPFQSITDLGVHDELGLVAQRGTLYVAWAVQGMVSAYRLPLTKNESPEYTIQTAENAGESGVAVNDDATRLYVSLNATGDVYAYELPYRLDEQPLKLDVAAQVGSLPYGVAVGHDRLFVTAGSLLAYRLPLKARSKPEATVSLGDGSPAGVTVAP